LSQLNRAGNSLTRQKYLEGGRDGKYIFLYHACSNNALLHVFALFFPNGAVKLHQIDPATRRQAIPRLADVFTELLQKHLATSPSNKAVTYPTSREFAAPSYHSSIVTALKAVSRELALFVEKSYTLVVSSAKELSFFETLAPNLSKFPILSMPKTKLSHSLDVFPWQTHVAQRMLSRYLTLGPWLDRLISLADYYDVPVGPRPLEYRKRSVHSTINSFSTKTNTQQRSQKSSLATFSPLSSISTRRTTTSTLIDGDQPLLLSDISFARRLIQRDMVIWWSPGELPDLGGTEHDKSNMEDLPNTKFVSPGCYSTVCLEVAVRNLAHSTYFVCVHPDAVHAPGRLVPHPGGVYIHPDGHLSSIFGVGRWLVRSGDGWSGRATSGSGVGDHRPIISPITLVAL
jgi:DNA polymerase epsilon subunit 1